MDESLLEGYQEYLSLTKRHPHNTVVSYLRDVRQFSAFMRDRLGVGVVWNDVTSTHAAEYLGQMAARGVSQTSINRAITSLHLYYDYLATANHFTGNPIRDLKHIKVAPRPPTILTTAEILRLVGAPAREYEHYMQFGRGRDPQAFGCFTFVRDQLILELFYHTGLKVGELCALSLSELDLANAKLVIQGRKGRDIPFPANVATTGTKYLQLRENVVSRSPVKVGDTLFLNHLGGAITERSVQRLVSEWAVKAGLHPNISPTVLRDTFTADLLDRQAKASTIQYLLGLEDLATAELHLARFALLDPPKAVAPEMGENGPAPVPSFDI